MNIDSANTRSFAEFHAFHERLNLGVKTSTVSLIVMDTLLSNGAKSIEEIKADCYADGSLWGGMPGWSDVEGARRAISMAKHEIGRAGVIQAFSAFDVFIETLDGELEAWSRAIEKIKLQEGREKISISNPISKFSDLPVAHDPQQLKEADSLQLEDEVDPDAEGRAFRFYERYQWNTASIDYLIPVYTYFRRLRNCIAHSDSRATPGLVEAASNAAWAETLEKWSQETSDVTLPNPHPYKDKDVISITHREALLASSMLRLLALDMSTRALSILGPEGLLYLIVSKAVKNKTPVVVGGKTLTSLLHVHLEEHCRVKQTSNTETRRMLEQLGLWRDWKEWHHVVREKTTAERKLHKVFKEKSKHWSKKG